MKGDKVIADEEVLYTLNRAILLRQNTYILRNTWTGEEKEITAEEAKTLMERMI